MSAMSKWFRELLYEEATAEVRIISTWERPGIMRKHIVTGAMGMMYFQLVTGMYLVAFGGNIGLEYWHWGLLGALSSLVLVVQPLSAYMVGRVWNRKSLWFISAMVARPLRGLAIAAAYGLFGVSDELGRSLFIAFLVLANFFDAISVPPWFSWLVDIIPEDEHGRFMGRRSAWIALANVLVVIPIGYVMDRVNGGEGFTALLVVFGIGMAMGLLDLWIHRTIPEPPMRSAGEKSFWEELAVPLRDRAYRPWLVFSGVWTFGMMLGAALAGVYFVEKLGLRRDFFGGSLVLIVIPMGASVFAGHWLGRLVDRHGVKATLRWSHWVWAVLPLFWFVATPERALLWLGLGSLVAGIGAEAALNAGTKLVTRFRPTQDVPMYWAVSTSVSAISGAVGSLAAGLVLQGLGERSWAVWGFALTGFHAIFIASFVLRGGSTWLISQINVETETRKD